MLIGRRIVIKIGTPIVKKKFFTIQDRLIHQVQAYRLDGAVVKMKIMMLTGVL